MIFDIFRFSPGTTIIHRLDPRAKLLLSLVLSVAAILSPRLSVTIAIIGLSLLLWLIAGATWRQWMSLSILLLNTVIFISAVETFGTPPELGGAEFRGMDYFERFFNVDAWLYHVSVALRFVPPLISGLLTAITTDPMRMVAALRRWHLPEAVALMVSFALRQIPSLYDQFNLTVRAMQARGSPVGTWRGIPAIFRTITPVVIGTLRSAQTTSFSIESRGYGAAERTSFFDNRFGRLEAIFFAALGLTLWAIFTFVQVSIRGR
jgi:energy-coupling factor transport system permease protein